MIQISKDIKIKDVTNVVNEKNPSFSGIVNQECKGNLWVDNIEKPRIAIAESYAAGSFAFLGIYRIEEEDFLKVRLLESWYTFEEFKNKSIAYCIILENRIVAVMVGTASFNNVISIDIEAEKEHRRKGLAYAMAVAFIKDCLKNEFIPQWDCVESNPNSYHMATKLGFEKISENTVYWFNIS